MGCDHRLCKVEVVDSDRAGNICTVGTSVCVRCQAHWQCAVELTPEQAARPDAREGLLAHIYGALELAAFPGRVAFVVHPADLAHLMSAEMRLKQDEIACVRCQTRFVPHGAGYTARLQRRGCPVCADGVLLADRTLAAAP